MSSEIPVKKARCVAHRGEIGPFETPARLIAVAMATNESTTSTVAQ
jgi:hypothetical protein